ncbi:MAG: UvrD-helicase domain-containing protein [Pseudomarimonas sp.]
MSEVPDFDPLRVPLEGLQLVEASAGTGKTWSIVSLLLRVIALEGRAIDSAVVVTFTEAATRELAQRLRQRLEEALDVIDGRASGDEFITEMQAEAARRGLPPILIRQRIFDALVRCDEAWVATIHGLCARWISEFAFEQHVGLIAWPADDGSRQRQQAVADVWRQQVVLAGREQAELLIDLFGHADALGKSLAPLLAIDAQHVDGAPDPGRYAALRQRSDVLRAIPPQLEESGEFERLWAHLDEPRRYSGTKLSQAHKAKAMHLCARAVAGSPPLDAVALERVTTAALSKARNDKFASQAVPPLPALKWIDAWCALRAELAPLESMVWLHQLLAAVRTREATLRSQQRTLSYDDLVLHMRDRLQGQDGERFATQLAARFPLALVDEFQDTDAAQYAIFRAIYFGRAEAGLFLVGDPKQAIYRFRGGDVFAYRRAMRDADARHRLRFNRRSRQRTVDAVNALFTSREQPFVFDFIGFEPAQLPPPTRADIDTCEGGLTLWRLPDSGGAIGQGEAERLAIDAVAATIAEMVASGEVQASAIAPVAVLVRTHAQAKAIRRALARWGIACAYAGDGSVWASDAARAVLVVIDALANPRDAGRQRRALAGDLFALDARELGADGEAAVTRERALDALAQARARGEHSGPAAALLPLIADAASAQLQRAEGRRWLCDALHVLELLGARWPEVEHLAGLAEQMQQAIAQASDREFKPLDADRLRAETDRACVQLLTVHGSKGLQFEYVFAPFLWRGAAQSLKDPLPASVKPVTWHDNEGSLRRDPGSPAWIAHAREDAREQFAESIRLMYVALTRAKRRSWLIWGDTRHASGPAFASVSSPLAYMLHREEGACSDGWVEANAVAAFGNAAIERALTDWNTRAGGALTVEPLPASAPLRKVVQQDSLQPSPPRHFGGSITPNRRVYSYSRLFGGFAEQVAERPDHDVAAVAAEDETEASDLSAPQEIGGSRFGECAHAALELIDFARWPDAAGNSAIDAACRRFGFETNAATYLRDRVDVLCKAPLIDGLRLRHLPAADRLAELEFFFPLTDAALNGFLAIVNRSHDDHGEQGISREHLNGFMRGFIDLVVRWQGRYYVFDYKTNRLGATLAHYAPAALAAAVRGAGYDLQYLLYSLAVHRHLRARLGEAYDYSRDFGGVCYVFLRGLDVSGEHGVFVDRPSYSMISALDAWANGMTLP